MSRILIEFVERLPFTPLLIDSSFNVVKVKLTADDKPVADEPVSWYIPQYNGVFFDNNAPTKTGKDGIATKRIYIAEDAVLPERLTVSAWLANATKSEDGRTSVLFESIRARVFCSFETRSAHTWPAAETEPRSDQLVSATTTILDGDSRPVRGLTFYWRMLPNAPTAAYRRLADGSLHNLQWQDSPSYEKGYRTVTLEDGKSNILFANSASQLMELAPTINAILYPQTAVFTDVDLGTGEGTQPKLPLDNNTLNLDSYPNAVPVTLPAAIGTTADGAIWLNGAIVKVVHAGTFASPRPIPISSLAFIPRTQNSMGAVYELPGANAQDSARLNFSVKGSAQVPQPSQGGTLVAPSLAIGGVTIVNDSIISGGLAIRIPDYDGIAVGDSVALNVYLHGYYNGVYPRDGNLVLTHEVGESDKKTGFVLIVPEDMLEGYGALKSGEPGTLQAQYVVEGLESSAWSRIFEIPMVTTDPNQSALVELQ